MNPFAGIASGFREQDQMNQRRRSEMADAFVQFRQANPHASLTEMQQWIDARAGGRNYIAGGAPSGSVLQGIATENLRNKNIADQQRRLADLAQRQRLNESLRSSAATYMRQFNGDVVAASEAFRNDLGGDMAGMDIGGLFTPEAWKREVTQMTHKFLPQAQSFIKDNSTIAEDGTVTSPSPEDVSEYLGIPLDVARSITASTQKQLEADKAARDRVTQERAKQQRRQILKDVIEQAERGRDATEVFADYFDEEALGVIDQTFFDDIVEEANKEKQRRDDERLSGFKTQALTTAAALLPRVKEQLIDQDSAGARRTLQRAFDALTPEAQEALGPEWVEDQYQEALASAQGIQDRQRAQAHLEARATAANVGETVIRASKEAAANATSLGVAQNAVNALAENFALDSGAVAIAANAIQALGQDAAIEDQIAAGGNALTQAGVPSITQASETARERALSTSISEVDVTPEEYENELGVQLMEFGENWTMGINKLAETHANNPMALIGSLNALKTRIRGSAATIRNAVQSDLIAGQGGNPLSPITVGTGAINEAASVQFLEDIVSTQNNLLAKIDEKIAEAQAQESAARERVLNPPPVIPTAPPGATGLTTRPVTSSDIEELKDFLNNR